MILKKCFTVCYLLYMAYLIYWSDIKNYSYTNKNGVKQRTEVFAPQMWKACLSDIKYSSNKDDYSLYNYLHLNRSVKKLIHWIKLFYEFKRKLQAKILTTHTGTMSKKVGGVWAIVAQVFKIITRHNRTNHLKWLKPICYIYNENV